MTALFLEPAAIHPVGRGIAEPCAKRRFARWAVRRCWRDESSPHLPSVRIVVHPIPSVSSAGS